MPESAVASSASLIEAIAYLSQKIDEFQIQQIQSAENTERVLDEWSQVNITLTNCLHEQMENNQTHLEQQQQLALHLLTLKESSNVLEVSSVKLEGSLSNLTQHLGETQAVQLDELSKNNQDLQTSTTSLISYLKGDQTKRLEVLETSLASLIEIMEQIPGLESVRTNTGKKGWNFDFAQIMAGISTCSLCTAALVLGVWHVGGASEHLTRVDERATWALMKLERIESALGIQPEAQ